MADDTHKFHCLRAMVEGGHIARMNRTELAVYISLYNDADGRTRRVAVSADRVARTSGMGNVGRCRRQMAELETQGYIKTVEGDELGGRNRVKVRELLIPEALPAAPLFDSAGTSDTPPETVHTTPTATPAATPNTGTPVVPVSHTHKGGHFQHANRDSFAPKPGHFSTETGTPHVPRSQYSREITAHHGGDDGCGVCPGGEARPPTPSPAPASSTPPPPSPTPTPRPDVLEYLTKAGIHLRPATSYAAAYTLDRVRALHRQVLDKPKVRDRAALFNSILSNNMPATVAGGK